MTNAVYWELTDVPVPLLTPNSHSFPQYLPSPVHYSFLRTLLQTHRNVFSGFLHADQPKSQRTFSSIHFWIWSINGSWRILACPSADIRKNTHYTQKHSHPPEIWLVTKSWPHQSQPTISWQQTTQKIVVAPRAAQNPLSPQPAPIWSTAVYTETHSIRSPGRTSTERLKFTFKQKSWNGELPASRILEKRVCPGQGHPQ